MKQKFSLSIVQGADLNIKEFAELEKDGLSLLCDETYEAATVADALAAGPRAVIQLLRTPHFFPNRTSSELLAEAVIRLFQEQPADSIDILIDDADGLPGKRRAETIPEPTEPDENAGIDDLLDDDMAEPIDGDIQEDLNVETLSDTKTIADAVPNQTHSDT